MAQRITSSLVCDMPHDAETAGEETVAFGYQCTDYAIDLCELDSSSLRRLLTRYAAHGRRTGGSARPGGNRWPHRTEAARRDATARRTALIEWGARQDPPVVIGRTGGISPAVLAGYKADQGSAVPAAPVSVPPRETPPPGSKAEKKAIREWAAARQPPVDLPAQGRIPADVALRFRYEMSAAETAGG